ncbi:MAG TPA: GNAT family N-acetyltransferase [Pseudonocardiaceae bacterium]
MSPSIRPLEDRDHEDVVALSLRAWAPVFTSLEYVLKGSEVFGQLHPDWRVSQQDAVAAVCSSDTIRAWVAEDDSAVAGFVAVQLDHEHSIGEIHMLAVDPTHQHRGIGTSLTAFALDRIEEAGMAIAMVETGADPSHAAARRTYEQAGFTALPVVRYFKKL